MKKKQNAPQLAHEVGTLAHIVLVGRYQVVGGALLAAFLGCHQEAIAVLHEDVVHCSPSTRATHTEVTLQIQREATQEEAT